MDENTQIRILLLGKTGTGKSHVGNVILKKEKFGSSNNTNAVTGGCSLESLEYRGYHVDIVDTPGFGDAEIDQETLDTHMKWASILTSPGPHTFLLCVQLAKVVQADLDVLEKYKKTFGEKMGSNTIVVFTLKDWKENEDQIDYIKNKLNLSMRTFLQENCDNHYYCLGKKDQTDNLIDKIIKRNTRCYTTPRSYAIEREMQLKMFDDAKLYRRKLKDDITFSSTLVNKI